MTYPNQPTLPVCKIVQGKNPREYFDPAEMTELEDGIRAVGVLEPIVVRPVSGTDLYEIIAGERRWRAAKNVFGDDYDMPVVIKDASDEATTAIPKERAKNAGSRKRAMTGVPSGFTAKIAPKTTPGRRGDASRSSNVPR